jgi:serine protease AprX
MVSAQVITETIADNFDTKAYSNNTGTQLWASNWTEINDDNNVGGGKVKIDKELLKLEETDRGVQRAADLGDATTAVLTFQYRREKFKDGKTVDVEISTNGGATWNQIAQINGYVNESTFHPASLDISAFAGSPMILRFFSGPIGDGKLWVDNLQIEYTVGNMPPPPPDDGGDDAGGSPLLTDNVRDEFNGVTFDGNDGSDAWVDNWLEEDNGVWDAATEAEIYRSPADGYVQIVNGELRINNSNTDDRNPGVERTVDLGVATQATLSFDFRTSSSVGVYDGIAIEVSPDGGSDYILLETIQGLSGAVSGSRSYDITRYATNDTKIRIRVAYFFGLDNHYFYVDNIDVTYGYDGDYPLYGFSQTVADNFNTYPYTYSANSGSQNWLNDWQEINDDGAPLSGDAHYTGFTGGYRVFTFWTDAGETWQPARGIWRAADLSGANWAEFGFRYMRGSMDVQDYMAAEVSLDGGIIWTEVGRIYGKGTTAIPGSDEGWLHAYFDISDYISSNTAVRLITNFDQNDYYDNIYLDDVEIIYNKPPENQMANTYLDTLNVRPVWDMGYDGSGITVAVVDSGVALDYDFSADYGQPEADRVLIQEGFNDTSRFVHDNFGHGTHVAGIIGGNGAGSNEGYQGIAPGVNLIGLKVSDDNGMAYESDTVDALQWIFDHKDEYNIRVVNLSLNSSVEQSYNESALDAAAEILWLNGIVVVASSGNSWGGQYDVNAAPANDPLIITVGASEESYTSNRNDDWVASFTQQGISFDGFQKPEVIAPGKDIISVLASSSWWQNDYPERYVDGGYFRISGTSMAAPMVSGAVALLLQAEPNLTPDQVKYRLMNTGSSIYSEFEYPYLDVYDLITTSTTESANANVVPHELLAKMALIAYWASENGDENIDWENVDWDAVDWSSVNWASVNWASVNWASVNWASVNWGSVNWGSVNWGSVNWGSVNWGSVNWGSVNWGSVNWGSVNWGSVSWDD